MPVVQFKKIGQWNEVTQLTRGIKSDLQYITVGILEDWGHRAEQIAKGHITAEDLGWAPLSEVTIQRKKEANFPYIDEILRATNTYYSNIQFWLNRRGYKADKVMVGVQDGIKHPSGLDLGGIAVTHEYGAWELNIPARPLWGPVLEEMVTNETQDVFDEAYLLLSIRLRRKYQMNAQIL